MYGCGAGNLPSEVVPAVSLTLKHQPERDARDRAKRTPYRAGAGIVVEARTDSTSMKHVSLTKAWES